MKLERLSTGWGSYVVDTSLLVPGTVAMLAGVGPEAGLEEVLLRNYSGVGVMSSDPTALGVRVIKAVQSRFPGRLGFQRVALASTTGDRVVIGGAARSLLADSGELAYTLSLDDWMTTGVQHYLSHNEDDRNKAFLSVRKDPTEICLLKLNIEGAEYGVLDASTWPVAPYQLAIEWHHWLGKEGDGRSDPDIKNPFTLEDTCRHIASLLECGYALVHQSTYEEHRVIQSTLFVRKDRL